MDGNNSSIQRFMKEWQSYESQMQGMHKAVRMAEKAWKVGGMMGWKRSPTNKPNLHFY